MDGWIMLLIRYFEFANYVLIHLWTEYWSMQIWYSVFLTTQLHKYAFIEYILMTIMMVVDLNWFRGTHLRTQEWEPKNCQEPERQEAVKQSVKRELLWQIHTQAHSWFKLASRPVFAKSATPENDSTSLVLQMLAGWLLLRLWTACGGCW